VHILSSMSEAPEHYGPIHYLDADRTLPLCKSVDSRMWSWTSIATTVTCRRCRTLLVLAADASAGSKHLPTH
jgi:hypothetical protein